MKQYEVYAEDWNALHTDTESDIYNAQVFETYAEAVEQAKKLSMKHAFARIDLYQLNKSQCDSEAEYEEELMYNRGAHLRWCEKYENGKQCPMVYIAGREIWRWNMQGGAEDLKPKN